MHKILEKLSGPFENQIMKSNGPFYFICLFALVFNLSFIALAEEVKKVETTPSSTSDIFYLCKKDRFVRWLRAVRSDGGKCSTQYVKGGFLQIVGSGSYFPSCESILNSVKKNLEEGGFTCSLTSQFSVLEL